jgi:predicted transcriptional regulator of viral defense system
MQKTTDFSAWVDNLQSGGRYTFDRDEAISALQVSDVAFQSAARRLATKGRIVAPRRGFYVIVPLEYKKSGAPPASWFIDELMKFHKHPYYVGLLSAAAIHGAAHQQPQEFQVVTDTSFRPALVGRSRIRFFLKSHFAETSVTQTKTDAGMIRVSTPEATAMDLVRYAKSAGDLGNVATVLRELSERIKPDLLAAAARKEPELSIVQRTGFLLDRFGSVRVTDPLAQWLSTRKTRLAPLRPERNAKINQKDPRWNLVINEDVEAD